MDAGTPLKNRKHERFARAIALGELTAAEAYRATVSDKGTKKTSHENASKLVTDTKVGPRIKWFIERANEKLKDEAEGVVMSVIEKRMFLAEVVRTAAGEVDRSSKLCQEWSETRGEGSTSQRLKMPDKLKAIQIDNDLAGEGGQAKLGTAVEALAKLMGVKK